MALKAKLGFMASLGYGRMKPEDVLKSLKGIGYEGVEWTRAHFDPRKKSEAELKALVQMTKDHGMAVSEVVVQQDYVCLDEKEREDRIRYTIETIEAAAAVGVATLNVFTGPALWNPKSPKMPSGISEGAAWKLVLDAFGRIVPAAESSKVHLAVEGVWGMLCRDFYTTRVLIDHFNSPWLGVNFDPSHDILVNNLDTGWIARQWGDRIRHVHLKDAVGVPGPGKFLFPLLGEGRVDWKGLFQALDETGYDGFMSVEFESFDYYRQILQSNIEKAAQLSMDAIRKLIAL